eukprot:TRINITY_DN21206_c0_g1_i1.p1 TRINITY_DN21206_c0_g1~~TRINITY_DN21206_c0_g1_i1.p1  ORF type:complete len:446 (+),score=128.45 TRINITY_DN21206_c0_g1_i1:262-1599(+)
MGKKGEATDGKPTDNPELQEKQRLRKLALRKKIISERKANSSDALKPSRAILNSDGKDIVKKGQRKSKFLFAFPGLVAPVSGGKMGDLMHLDTQNPVLYVDFPQGRMKFFGTIIYPKNKYMILHFFRGSGNVVCEDSFDSLVVFSDVWWIGTKEENPEELQLEFPKELDKEKHAEFDFKGGAGRDADSKIIAETDELANECNIFNADSDTNVNDLSDCKDIKSHPNKPDKPNVEKETKATLTPTRFSARTVGRSFKFAESSSEDDADIAEDDSSLSGSDKAPPPKRQKVNRSLETMLDFKEATQGKNGEGQCALQEEIGQEKDSVQHASSSKGLLIQSSIASYIVKDRKKDSRVNQKTPTARAKQNRQCDVKIEDGSESKGSQSDNDNDVLEIEEPSKKSKQSKTRKKEYAKSRKKSKGVRALFEEQSSSSFEPSEDVSDEDWTA